MLTIENGVPLPNGRNTKGSGKWQLMLKEMQPKQSVVATPNQTMSIRVAAKNIKCKIVTQTISEDEVRIWKIK